MTSLFLLEYEDISVLEDDLHTSRFTQFARSRQIRLLVTVAFHYRYSNEKRADALGQQALNLSHQWHHEQGEAYAMMVIAMSAIRLYPTTQGIQLAREAVALAELHHDLFLVAHCRFALAGQLFNNSLLREQLHYSQENLPLYYRAGTRDLLAFEHNRIGACYVNLGDYDLAELHLQLAEEEFLTLGDGYGKLGVLHNRTFLYKKQKAWDQAYASSQASLSLLSQLEKSQPGTIYNLRPYIYMVAADIAIQRSSYDSAEAYLQTAYALITIPEKQLRNHRLQSGVAWAFSRLALAKGDVDAALRYAEDVLTVVNEHHLSENRAEVHEWIATIHSARGDFAGAYEQMQLALKVTRAHLIELNLNAKAKDVFNVASEAIQGKQQLQQQNVQLQDALDELKLMHTRLAESSERDPLTQAYNRTYLTTHLFSLYDNETIWSQTGLLLLDVDNFKYINDTYLHETGDEVLVRLAHILRTDDALVVRLGGEEFVVVVQNLEMDALFEFADTTRLRIQEYSWQTLHPRLQVTVSIGVVRAVPPVTPKELLRQADAAMYLAKRSGKNRVMIANEMMTP